MKRPGLIVSLFLLTLANALPASAQTPTATVTVTVKGVHSSEGNILATLCDDPARQFPASCMSNRTLAKAEEGETVLTFDGVVDGRYVMQAFHDEDGSFTPNIPPEGAAISNDAAWPPTFDKAAFTVTGEMSITVTMIYPPSPPAATAQPASHGAPAPEHATREDVRANGLNGVLYRPAGDKSAPLIIMLGGSEGGLQAASRVGVGFVQHGYAVLALAYFMDEGLPQTLENIPLEYFDRALDWAKAQSGIDAKRIGVFGGSRGSEAALLLASRRSEIKAAAAFAPSGFVWQGLNFENPMNMGPAWTTSGKALPFLKPDGRAYLPGAAMKPMFDHALAQADAHPDAAIPVEKINGPILLMSGKADALWPSAEMSDRIVTRLKAKHFKHVVTHLSYEGAGHLVFVGDPSTTGALAAGKAAPNPMLGGTGEGNMAAWTDDWPKALAFFDKALKE
jgi:dienelactone hydrolase/uncharacterized protein (DUF2141 family)